MKKILSALLAVMLVMSASITAFGATKNDVDKKINSSFAYLSEEAGENGYTAEKNLKDFYFAACAGADVSSYKDAFLASVKAALEAGEITSADNAVLITGALINMGIDATDFEGFNLAQMLKEISADTCTTPYTLAYGIRVLNALSDNETAEKYAEKLAGYYTEGKGTDFWNGYGTSPDDLSIFIIGLAPMGEKYEALVNDALALLETYYTEQGYSNYGANADSTALALAVYSDLGNKEKADSIYDMLIANFYDNETGGFKAQYDPYYATADALYGLSFYKALADEDKPAPEEQTTAKPADTAKKDTQSSNKTTAVKNESKKSPATGASISAAAALFALSTAAGLSLITGIKKKENN